MKKYALAIPLALSFIITIFYSTRSTTEQKQVFPPMSGARKALEFISSVRAYPEKDIPSAGFAIAFELSQQQQQTARLAKTQGYGGLVSWQAIGPHNVGGRTLAIALNPQNTNTLYAGSASGGLWRSYSGGKGSNAWHQVSTGFPVLGVSSIVIAPEDSNIIYIGTGEMYGNPVSHPGVLGERLNRGSYGIGILKTTDAGRTWNKSLDWLYDERKAVQMVRLNPQRSATVWAATTEGTFRSYDAGATWEQVHGVVMATDLVINNLDTNIVIVGCGGMTSPGHGIYTTTNNGQTWTKVFIPGVATFNGKVRLSISASSPSTVFASIGRNNGSVFNQINGTWLAKTENSGSSWTVVTTRDYSSLQGWYSHDVAVHPTNPNIVWTAGQPQTPFFSDNGGSNLTSASNRGLLRTHSETGQLRLPSRHADYHHIIYSPTDPDVIYFAGDGGIFLTEDGGRTIRNCNRGYQTTQFYNGSSSSVTDSVFALGGTQDNGSYAYEGDLFWRQIEGGDGSWTAINQNNNNIIHYSWQWLSMRKSTDKARFDSRNNFPGANELTTNFIAPFFLSPADNLTMYAGSNVVYKQVGFNGFWQIVNAGAPLDGNPLIAMAGSYQTPDLVYAATSPGAARGHVLKTIDGGDSWADITRNLPDRFLTDLAVHPNNDETVLLTVGGFGTSHVFRSDDGGAAWSDIGTGLPDVPTWSVIVDPDYPQQIFVGSDLGIYYSPDGGLSWQPHSAGLPDAFIAMDLTISNSNRKLRVATHGNGFFESYLPEPGPSSVAGEESTLPNMITLEQNYPNPFNPETSIRYFLHKETHLELAIYNTRGQMVRRLLSESLSAGEHTINWDGKNEQGSAVSSGVYVYRLTTAAQVVSRKMMLLR